MPKKTYSDLPTGAVVYDDLPPGAAIVGVQPPLPAGATGPLPTPSAHGAAPIGMTSDLPGDSADFRTRLLGKSGNEDMITAIPRHVKQLAQGVGQTVAHPLNTAKQVLYDAPKQSLQESADAFNAGRIADGFSKFAESVPVLGPWTKSIVDDEKQHGTIPALIGLGTDLLGGEAVGAAAKGLTKAAGGAATVAGASPESLALATTRKLVPGTPGEVMTRALKPSVKVGANPDALFNDTMGDVLQQNPNPKGVEGYAKATDAAKQANANGYQSVMAPYGGSSPRPLYINGDAVASAQMDSIPKMSQFEDATTGVTGKTAAKADAYRKWIPAEQADELRKGANQRLHGFYNQAEGDQYAALGKPEAARVKAVGDTIRDHLYPSVEADQGLPSGSIAQGQQQYGKLSSVSDIANKRDVVFSRQDPISLAEKVVAGHPSGISTRVIDFAGQRLLKNLTDSDAMVRSAVDRYQNPSGTPLQPGIRPLFGAGKFARANAGTVGAVARYGTYASGPISRAVNQ